MHILILSTADWRAPVWTNKQYLARGLAQKGFRVTYCESLGLRRVRPTGSDALRVVARFKRGSDDGEAGVGDGEVLIRSPLVVPAYYARTSSINRWLLPRQLPEWIGSPQSDRILWSFSPITYGLENLAQRTIYHSVDLLQFFPNVNRGAYLRQERELVRAADYTIASSQPIADHLKDQGATSVRLWENVAQVTIIANLSQAAAEQGHPEGAVFAGNLTSAKVDWNLLTSIVEDYAVPLHLAGPIDDGSGQGVPPSQLQSLLAKRGVTYHGVLDQAELARLMGSCRVGLIPYQINPYTSGVYPMKTFEYLAAGLPVVTTPLPSLLRGQRPLPADVEVVSASDFARTVAGLTQFPPSIDQRRQRAEAARTAGWESRIGQAAALLAQAGGSRVA